MARPNRRKPSAKSSQRPSRGAGRSGGRSRSGSFRQDEGREEADSGPDQRLQKVLAAAGIGSRRDCEEYIREGRVEVDRKVITELGTKVDPLRQEIRVDGEALRQPKRLYFAINKPEGVLTTNYDPTGRPRVIDLVPTDERVFAVGRLDRASEGLILVTNDGEFANRITHPRYGVEKTYLVRVAGQPQAEDLAKLQKGVYLSDGFCRVQSITVKSKHGRSTDLLMVLNEGRNRELRRVLAKVGHKVLRLKRIAVGSIKLGDLEPGAWRRLLPAEIETLLELAREKRKATKSKKKKTKSGGVKPVGGEGVETPYVQKQALLAQPLTLADLLQDDAEDDEQVETLGDLPAGLGVGRDDDDLDDDALAAEWPDGDDDELAMSPSDFSSDRPGEVLGYEDDEETASPPQPAGKRPDRQGSGGGGPNRKRPSGRPPQGETSRYGAERPPGRRGGKPGGGKPGRGKQRPASSRSEESSTAVGRPARGKFSSGRPGGGRPKAGRPSSGRPSSGRPSSGTGRQNAGRSEGQSSTGRPAANRSGGSRPNAGLPSAGQPRGDKRGGPGGGPRSGPPRSGPPGGRPPAGGKFGKPGGKRKGRR